MEEAASSSGAADSGSAHPRHGGEDVAEAMLSPLLEAQSAVSQATASGKVPFQRKVV